MQSESIQKYQFARMLEQLRSITGHGTELISVYIPPGRPIAEVVNHLRQEWSQAQNIKSKSTRVNVQTSLELIMDRLKQFRSPPPNGLAIFCGAIPHGDRTKHETWIVNPIEPLNIYKYHCDSKFFLEPLEQMLQERKLYGLLTIDRKEATIGFLIGTRIEIRKHLMSNVPAKHRKGGSSAMRFQRLREIALEEFFKKVGQLASEIFLNEPKLEGVLVGGPAPTKDEFLAGDYLDYRIAGKLIGSVEICYTDEYGLEELVRRSEHLLSQHELTKQRKLMQRFLEELAKGGLAVYGEQRVREELAQGRAEIVLVSEKLRRYRIKYSCECGFQQERTMDFEQRLSCQSCGKLMEIQEIRDLLHRIQRGDPAP